ncbi:hypothetical protein O181_036064 [Austropuccinia psidii MF-1]|uniref:Integrase zinc-binding domain-containing protein n=1 Tax=Austropuccinia psidii MF-1 TaxID=1389203 RepID=A0A9Q3D3Y1_9BASI|nr:hypothetical protein [Austropuccinia psidii MF-1]
MKDCKDPSLSLKFVELWKKACDEGRFDLLDGIISHRMKNTCVIDLTERVLINTILHEFHEGVVSGNLSEDKTSEKMESCSWWTNWRKDVAKYLKTCDRCQKENRATGKNLTIIIQTQNQKPHGR